jgi:hypothetical protein
MWGVFGRHQFVSNLISCILAGWKVSFRWETFANFSPQNIRSLPLMSDKLWTFGKWVYLGSKKVLRDYKKFTPIREEITQASPTVIFLFINIDFCCNCRLNCPMTACSLALNNKAAKHHNFSYYPSPIEQAEILCSFGWQQGNLGVRKFTPSGSHALARYTAFIDGSPGVKMGRRINSVEQIRSVGCLHSTAVDEAHLSPGARSLSYARSGNRVNFASDYLSDSNSYLRANSHLVAVEVQG